MPKSLDSTASRWCLGLSFSAKTLSSESASLARGAAPEEIDLDRVKAAEAKAREKLSHLDRASEEFLKAEASLKKALARELLARRHSGTGSLR